MRLLLATRSAHKAGEIRKILAHVPGLELVNLDDVGIPETPEEEGIEAGGRREGELDPGPALGEEAERSRQGADVVAHLLGAAPRQDGDDRPRRVQPG